MDAKFSSKYEKEILRQISLIENDYPISLRDYQKEIVIECFDEIIKNVKNKEKSSILIEAPTGAGKTVIGLMIVKMLETFYYIDASTNWCAMRRELLTQAKQANSTDFSLNNNMNYVSLFASDVPTGQILVMDEAHHDSTFSGSNIHKMSEAQVVLGLTATPARGDQVDLYFKKKIHSANTQRLVDSGYLMQYNHYFLSDWNNTLILESYLAHQKEFGQTIFFVKNMQECEDLTGLLKAHGVLVEQIHSKLNEEDRVNNLKMFKNKELTCLVNINVLTEGFDYDDLQTAFVRPSQKSLTKQMAGRALRLSVLFDNVNIVQSSDSTFKYNNEVKPLKTYKYYSVEKGWEVDKLDIREIDNFIESQNLNAIIEMQKRNGMLDKANLIVKNMTFKIDKNSNFEAYKKECRKLDLIRKETKLDFKIFISVRNILESIMNRKELRIKDSKNYEKEYCCNVIINFLTQGNIDKSKYSTLVGYLVEKNTLTDDEKLKLRKTDTKTKKNVQLSFGSEIEAIQAIMK